MNATTDFMSCEQFADGLAPYLENELPDGTRRLLETHAQSCADCGALLRDLGALQLQASALPQLTPSRDLWAGIADRIDARVLPLDAPRTERTTRFNRRWLTPGIAAAALVLVTAGITHFWTKASYAPSSTAASATRVASTSQNAQTAPVNVSASQPATDGEISSTLTERGAAPARKAGARSATSTVRLASTDPLSDVEPVYNEEIVKLRRIVRERRSLLDPKTVTVLEQSIAVIDSAIAQSRAALAKDPASGFLATQLNHSLEKKVELLRTAALLPART